MHEMGDKEVHAGNRREPFCVYTDAGVCDKLFHALGAIEDVLCAANAPIQDVQSRFSVHFLFTAGSAFPVGKIVAQIKKRGIWERFPWFSTTRGCFQKLVKSSCQEVSRVEKFAASQLVQLLAEPRLQSIIRRRHEGG